MARRAGLQENRMLYPTFHVKQLLEVYWDLWLAPGIDFEIVWIYHPGTEPCQEKLL